MLTSAAGHFASVAGSTAQMAMATINNLDMAKEADSCCEMLLQHVAGSVGGHVKKWRESVRTVQALSLDGMDISFNGNEE